MQIIQGISTKELRDNLAEILERVAIGKQSFLVSKFGREKALITPVNSDLTDRKGRKVKKILKNLSFYGMWEDREEMKDSASWVLKLRERQNSRIIDGGED